MSNHRAIDNGANALAEGFLFGVATLLIIGETWRSSRTQAKRREGVDDKLDELKASVEALFSSADDPPTAADSKVNYIYKSFLCTNQMI